jgi:hypothetical protein
VKVGDWFSFSKRDGFPNHVEYVPLSLKLCKESFFYINVGIFPYAMTFRDIMVKLKDDPPPTISYTNTIYTYMCKTPTDPQEIPEDALAAARISRQWDSPDFRLVFNIDGKGKPF